MPKSGNTRDLEAYLEKRTRTMREVQIIHLQRSGGHAIANWIGHQCTAGCYFANDVCNPYVLEAMRKRPPRLPRDTEWIVYTVEDQPLQDIPGLLTKSARYLPILTDPNPIVILILRDVYNMLASRYAFKRTESGCQMGNLNQKVMDTWKQHALVFFYAQHGVGRRSGAECIPVNYNNWCQSAAYRCMLWDAISRPSHGMPGDFTDNGRLEVPTWACGSSFDTLNYDGKADQMDTLHRYKQVPVEVFKWVDPQAALLTEAIFGLKLDTPQDKEADHAS